MMNPAALFKLKGIQDTFVKNHPKFPNFLQAVKRKGIHADDVITITIETPEGEKIESNIRVQPSDVDAFNSLMELIQKQ